MLNDHFPQGVCNFANGEWIPDDYIQLLSRALHDSYLLVDLARLRGRHARRNSVVPCFASDDHTSVLTPRVLYEAMKITSQIY